MKISKELQQTLSKISNISFGVAAVSIILTAIGFLSNAKGFSISYLNNYVYFLGLTLGCFPFIMLHHLTSGDWGFPIRRFFEIMLKNVPLMGILSAPILLNLPILYHWADPEHVAHDPILQIKAPYLNVPFFLVRIVAYFIIWFILAHFLDKISRAFDAKPSHELQSKLQGLSGAGLLIYSLTVTFASVDLVMSIESHWFSTIYGVIFMVGFGLLAFTFAIVIINLLRKHDPFKKVFNNARNYDLGNLIFGFVLVLAYVSISQLIIIWSANLQEEAPWYLHRNANNWFALTILIVILQFAVPFFSLLIRNVKKNMNAVLKIAILIVIMRWIDIYWLVQPAYYDHVHFHWSDLACFLAIGGLWLGLFLRNLSTNDLVVFKQDPALNDNMH